LCRKVAHVYLIGGAYGLTEYAFRRATGDNPVSEWNVYRRPGSGSAGIRIRPRDHGAGTRGGDGTRSSIAASRTFERLEQVRATEARFLLDVAAYGASAARVVLAG